MRINKQYAIPALLISLFLMPFFLALWCYQSGVMRAGLVNQGQLVKTTVSIPDIQKSHKWRLVYATSAPCGQACLHALDTLARVRLALGRHLYGIELWLFLVETPSDDRLAYQLRAMDVHVQRVTHIPDGLRHASVWVVNHEGNGVLTYPDTTHPKAIYADLKKLSALWKN